MLNENLEEEIKMKRIKKVLAMLLCMTLIITSFSACKKSDSNEAKEDSDNAVTESASPTEAEKKLVEIDYSQPVEYSYWLYATPNDYYSSYSDNPVVQYMNKKFNMTLSFEQPAAGTESDALNLMFGTGEYTDLIDAAHYTGSISQLYEDGIIVNIADYLDYMPNLKKLLDSDEVFRKNSYDDQGRLLKIPVIKDSDPVMWGGMVYRRDILDTMTNGKIQFPSGNVDPTTIEDWDYMLPLMKQYFENSEMADYAILILPATGYFEVGNLVNSFGTGGSYYVKDGTVKFGPVEDGFYNYLKKMNEWYKAGYIYKDFATRTNDPFYFPNNALTYGNSAGVWFGISGQFASALSMPDSGLNVDVEGMADPIDTATGVTAAPNYLYTPYNQQTGGAMVSSSCENIERLMTTMDFLYTEEASYMKGYGLDKEHGSAENEIYKKLDMEDGAFTLAEDGTFALNKNLAAMGGPVTDQGALSGVRLPGLASEKYNLQFASKEQIAAEKKWLMYQDSSMTLPYSLSRTSEEDATYTTNQANIRDYMNTTIVKFILGTEELNDQSWADFKVQIETFGLQDNLTIQQAAYERYLAR